LATRKQGHFLNVEGLFDHWGELVEHRRLINGDQLDTKVLGDDCAVISDRVSTMDGLCDTNDLFYRRTYANKLCKLANQLKSEKYKPSRVEACFARARVAEESIPPLTLTTQPLKPQRAMYSLNSLHFSSIHFLGQNPRFVLSVARRSSSSLFKRSGSLKGAELMIKKREKLF
jgi:hypothetical protein